MIRSCLTWLDAYGKSSAGLLGTKVLSDVRAAQVVCSNKDQKNEGRIAPRPSVNTDPGFNSRL
jgi:hypothetical protein